MIRKTSLYLLLSFLILFMLLTWPVWRWLWGEWWRNDYYSHGILIVPIALYLAWRQVIRRVSLLAFASSGIIIFSAAGLLASAHKRRVSYGDKDHATSSYLPWRRWLLGSRMPEFARLH